MAPTQNNNGQRSPWTRVIAGLLVVIMAASSFVYGQTDVTLNALTHAEKSTRVAATQLLKNDGYANASRLERMTAYARDLLLGRHTLEDYEIAAQIAIASEQYDEAIAFTEKAIELYEGNEAGLGQLYLRLGYLYIMKGQDQLASDWLTLGIQASPSPEAYLARAQARLNQGMIQEALEDVTVYLNTAENAMELLPELINVYEAAGQYDTAAALYTRLIDSSGRNEYLLNRAYCYTSAGDMQNAALDRDQYAKAGGQEVGAADVMLGIGWMRAGEYALADQCFSRAISENYEDPEALYYYLVLCSYVTENFARACEYGDLLIEKVLRGEKAETASVGVENSTGTLKVTLAQMDLSSLCLMTGASHVIMGDYDRAVESLTACLEADQQVVYANYLRGSCLLAAGQYEAAMADFDRAIAAGEETEKSHYGRAMCRVELGDAQGAMEDFEWMMFNGQDQELFEESARQMKRLLEEDGAAEQNGEKN